MLADCSRVFHHPIPVWAYRKTSQGTSEVKHLVKEVGSTDLAQQKAGQVLSLKTSLDTAFISAAKGHVVIRIPADLSASFSASVLEKLALLKSNRNSENMMVWFR